MSAPLRTLSAAFKAAQTAAPDQAAATVQAASAGIEAQARSIDGTDETVVTVQNGAHATLGGVNATGRYQEDQPARSLAGVDISAVADGMADDLAARGVALITGAGR